MDSGPLYALILAFCMNVYAGGLGAQTLAASVLPTSRSVQVDNLGGAFATIINAGPGTALGCKIAPLTSIPAAFFYQTTDPATNAPSGTRNTPIDIPVGFQTFVFGFTPSAAFLPIEVELEFDCANTAPAQITPGVNTLVLSASGSAVPDIVALAAAPGGAVDIPGPSGTGVFAVATVNVGAAETITASADTGDRSLPVNLAMCETEPSTGVCINPTSPTHLPVTSTIAAGDTPTFGVFVTGSGRVSDDPGANRAFVRFSTTEAADDFSTARVDATRWAAREWVTRIRGGVLESTLHQFGRVRNNGLQFVDSNAVSSIEADVTVLEVERSGGAESLARLGGFFYNDTVSSSGLVGEVFGSIDIVEEDDGADDLTLRLVVVRCEDEDCNSLAVLLSDTTRFDAVPLGETRTLSIAFDGTGEFRFGVDGDIVTFDASTSAPVATPSRSPFKALSTRITGEIESAADGGYIDATFDNVFVNGASYDDFSSDRIDSSRWINQEFVREIDAGALQLELSRVNASGSNHFEFADQSPTAYAANVSIVEVTNNSSHARARLRGYFYNDGTPGDGRTGDIHADVELRHVDGRIRGVYFVGRCDDAACNNFTTFVFDDVSFGTVGLGETRRLSLAWDGTSLFTFGFGALSAQFNAASFAPVAGPVEFPSKGIGVRVSGVDATGEGAHILATFDNVEVLDGVLGRVSRGSTSVAIRTR